MNRAAFSILAAAITLLSIAAQVIAEENEGDARRRGSQLFFRLLGSETNAPILPKTRSAWTQDRQTRVGTTGSSDLGFTEYPFCFGTMDFTFIEEHAIYPRLISGVKADETIVNTADILADHVYEPDGCVWGPTARRFVQTFTATQPELVSITMLVASEPGTFRATLHEGGPAGPQIGPSKTFQSGHSMTWGTAQWTAGQAPLAPGRTYGIAIVREDGKAWTPYLHATGNAYDGGLLYVDDVPRAASDLAAWIVEEPADLRRGLIPGADENGWIYNVECLTFVPRTPNIRLISVAVVPITKDDLAGGYCDLVAHVFSDDGRMLTAPKRCLAHGPKEGPQTAHFVFATDELPVTPGRPYYVAIDSVPHKQAELPKDEDARVVARDIRGRVYGEPTPGGLPGIFNLSITCETESRLQFRWFEPFPCPTYIESFGPGVNSNKRFDVPAGTTDIVLPKFWAGHQYELRLTSVGPGGLKWSTPRYRIQMPRGDEFEPLVQPEYPEEFPVLAPPKSAAAPEYGPIRYLQQIEVNNNDFEQGLDGWNVAGDEPIETTESKHDIGVKWGKLMAGFTQLGGEKREQVFTTTNPSQQIETTPGHVYVLSAWAKTVAIGGPRGDTRVRLFADPTGGDNLSQPHCSQWYWTDGQWMRFQHQFRATAEKATIGCGMFRWRDIDQASVYVDHVTVFDLGPAPAAPGDPYPRRGVPTLVRTDPKMEVDDKVEARLHAPPGYVITGIGSRAHYDNITTMWLKIQPLLPDGTLGPAEQLRSGWEPDAGLEAEVTLPPGMVVTGFGAAIAPEWDVKRFRVWARTLAPDGSLGEEKEFRGGIDRVSGVEREIRAAPGRVLISAGLNCSFNDINGIKADSAALVPSAAAKP